MPDARRFRLDDLRRFASALAAASGLAPARAAALASHLLWYDAAGWSAAGIATLPQWLERLARGQVDPQAEGHIGPEHAGTAVFDGQNGLGPLILARAGQLADEKARDVGVGLVRVTGLGPTGPAAAVAAEMAIGPHLAALLGPGPSWAIAVPSPEGLPVVVDSELAEPPTPPASPSPPALLVPWAMLVPEGGWLVLSVVVSAYESLAALHERVADVLSRVGDERPSHLLPEPWDARRREVRERGVRLDRKTAEALRRWADRLGVEPLDHLG